MRHNPVMHGLSVLSIFLFLAVWLSACGGGGSSPAAPGTGSVSAVITDAPSDDFSAILVTIWQVDLIGDGQHVTLFRAETPEDEKTVDLLELSSFSEPFVYSDKVAEGKYSKIRLYVSDVSLLKKGDETNPLHAELPANGKIDLNPRKNFHVTEGETLYLQIDMDANKSIHIHETGSGKYMFRPVVFIDVLDKDFTGKLVRDHGVVMAIAADGSYFALCEPKVEPLADDMYEHCTKVYTGNASVFDEQADPVDLSAVQVGTELTAVGFIRHARGDDKDDFDDDDYDEKYEHFILNAEVIEIGVAGTYTTVAGVVRSEPASNTDSFILDETTTSSFDIQLQPETKIFSRDGSPRSYSDISLNQKAVADGVLSGNMLKSVLLVIDETDALSLDKLDATIVSIDYANNSMYVNDGTSDRLVTLGYGTTIFQITETVEGSFSDVVSLLDLKVGQLVNVYGEEQVDSSFAAAVILAN